MEATKSRNEGTLFKGTLIVSSLIVAGIIGATIATANPSAGHDQSQVPSPPALSETYEKAVHLIEDSDADEATQTQAIKQVEEHLRNFQSLQVKISDPTAKKLAGHLARAEILLIADQTRKPDREEQ